MGLMGLATASPGVQKPKTPPVEPERVVSFEIWAVSLTQASTIRDDSPVLPFVNEGLCRQYSYKQKIQKIQLVVVSRSI